MAKVTSKGTLLKVDIASTLTTVAQLLSCNGPSVEVQEVETPTLDASGASIPHSLTGWVQPGTVEFEIYWDPVLAVHLALTALLTTPAETDFSITYAAGTAMEFTGILKTLSPATAVGEFLKASGSIQLTGLATYPAAS